MMILDLENWVTSKNSIVVLRKSFFLYFSFIYLIYRGHDVSRQFSGVPLTLIVSCSLSLVILGGFFTLRLSLYLVMTTVQDDSTDCLQYFVMIVFISIISFPILPQTISFFFGQKSIRNNLSTSKLVIKFAYTLLSLNPILQNYNCRYIGTISRSNILNIMSLSSNTPYFKIINGFKIYIQGLNRSF